MRRIFHGRWARSLLLLTALLGSVLLGSSAALAQSDNILPVTQAYKLSADASAPGVLKLHWVIAPHYYLYRGRMKFTAGPGVTLGVAQLPAGDKHVDPYLGPVETYHHSVDATIPYTVAPGTTRLRLSVQFQGCHEVEPKICYPPHTEQLDLPLPAAAPVTSPDAGGAPGNNPLSAALGRLNGASPGPSEGRPLPAAQAFQFSAVAQDPHHLLLQWTMPKDYYVYQNHISLQLLNAGNLRLGAPAWPAGGVTHQDAQYGNVTVYFGQLELPVPVEGDTTGHRRLTLQASFLGCQDGGVCYPRMTRTVTVDLTSGAIAQGVATPPVAGHPTAATGASVTTTAGPGLIAALLLALGGGLILNLMPCVLPVLSIKAVSVIESGESPARRRRHALLYTAGVLASFIVLGLVVIMLKAAWGTQLQHAMVVAVLALVMLTSGLWLSGVVQFGSSLGNVGSSLANQPGWRGDFFVGVLAVVVASPCTGPLMGPALGYALTAPPALALLVFVALGLGLASPFLLIGFVPALARLLPRPGAWMETLKQFLAFPMYLAAVWLAWVLANQRGANAVGLLLVAAVMLAMSLWWFEKSRHRSIGNRAWVLVFALLTVVPLYALARLPARAGTHATESADVMPYNAQKLAALRAAGTPVFVDMSADWCITCQANEHAVLDTDTFRALLKRTGTVYMKGDWTNEDPAITKFLKHYHSPGVPLYVIFPRGGGKGQLLPTVLTADRVEQALTAGH
ncbi:protein-disulfide reductase DsbD [Dyella sp. A6]|uniref:protein-disulfide reductase DsbD family protein n=1 Tax=Dyella aluminiiresistens TaxID=3069105 RepID=UPI002E77527A|nr:protein-disulfide reductase DsbD [Dyella sp. A6]